MIIFNVLLKRDCYIFDFKHFISKLVKAKTHTNEKSENGMKIATSD